MKVLFVCKGNVGRSQMAAGLFTKYSGIKAFSAGIKVLENENQKLNEILLAEPVIRFMKKEGLNIAENTRNQLTPKMLGQFDKIIVMSEPKIIPEYLLQSKKVEFWDIQNPKEMDDKGYEKIISQIKSKVKNFILLNKL